MGMNGAKRFFGVSCSFWHNFWPYSDLFWRKSDFNENLFRTTRRFCVQNTDKKGDEILADSPSAAVCVSVSIFLPAHQWMVFSYNVSVSVSVFRMDTRAPSSSCSERIIGPCRRQGVNKTRPPSSLTHHASTEQPPISVLSTKFASIN